MYSNAKTVIRGNLTQEPRQENSNGTTVVNFTVAVNTSKKEGDKYLSDFYNVSVWGKTAEYILPKLDKGTEVLCFGEQMMQSYTDKKGIARTSPAIRATDIQVLARMKQTAKQTYDEPPLF